MFSLSSGKIWGKCVLILGSLNAVLKTSSRIDNTTLLLINLVITLNSIEVKMQKHFSSIFLSSTEYFQSGAIRMILSGSKPCICISGNLRLSWVSWVQRPKSFSKVVRFAFVWL